MQSIKEVYGINTISQLNNARDQFDDELTVKLSDLLGLLQKNILTQDITTIQQHMTQVEAWRVRLVKYHAVAAAFTEHAKDSTFLQSKTTDGGEKVIKIPEIERDAYRRKLSGGFSAIQLYLEGLIDCVDSRVNLAKKVLGIEADAPKQKYI